MKRLYYCLFFKLYQFFETAPSRWLSDWKAELILDVLEIFLLLSIVNYYSVSTKTILHLGRGWWVAGFVFLSVIIPNYLVFHHKENWKQIIQDYKHLPKRKSQLASILTLGIVLVILANLIFSFYLLSTIDWSLYR